MKGLIVMGVVALGALTAQVAHAANGDYCCPQQGSNQTQYSQQNGTQMQYSQQNGNQMHCSQQVGNQMQCPQPLGDQMQCPQCYEQPTGECYCRYVRYQPKTFCKPRCVEEQIPYCETKCRYVPEYYEVQKCRYVPQYYTETHCRQVPEYYKVQKCRTKTRTEYDRYYYYTPECTYWKRAATNCQQESCPCPTSNQ